jgi:hypothetical protein
MIIWVLLDAPFYAAVVLFFYLVLDVARSSLSSEDRFDLVYDSLGRTLLIGKTRWPELLVSGLMLAVLLIGFPLALYVVVSLFERILAPALASWLFLVLSSLGFLALAVYINLFIATMCIGLRRDIEQAV